MNVNDQWMLDRMQQMAASMASSLPQVGQNTDQAGKTEKGESFQDMMDKAKDQKVDAPKKDDAPKKAEKPESAQKPGETRKVEVTRNADGTESKKLNLTAEEAAMVAAGYAQLSPVMPDGSVWLVTVQDENGNPVLPLAALDPNGPNLDEYFVNTENDWVMEPTPELATALEQLLQETGDPRSVADIIGQLEQKLENSQVESKVELVVKPDAQFSLKPVSRGELDGGEPAEEDDDGLNAELMSSGPLFKEVKAAPVKVGETFELDTQQPEMDTQLADTIRMAAENGLRQVEIKLSPENLGALTIKLTQSADGSLQVILHTANPKAASLLTQHLDSLNMALQNYGQSQEVHVELQRNEDSQQAQQQFQQADPDGRNQQRHQQQRQEKQEERSEDFVQRLRLGLFGLEDI